MIEEVIQGLVTAAKAQLETSLVGVREVLDFDPEVLTDDQYPGLTFEFGGGPGGPNRLGGGSDFPFDIVGTLYCAASEPGAAQRQLRQLVYAGEGKGFIAFLNSIKGGTAKERVFHFSIGRIRTGFIRAGSTASAAASVNITVISRGRN